MATHHITYLSHPSDFFGTSCYQCGEPRSRAGESPMCWVSQHSASLHLRCLGNYLSTELEAGRLALDQDVEVVKNAKAINVLPAVAYFAAKALGRDDPSAVLPMPAYLCVVNRDDQECDHLLGPCACGSTHSAEDQGAESLYERLLNGVRPMTREGQYARLSCAAFANYCVRYGWHLVKPDTYCKQGVVVFVHPEHNETNVDRILLVDGPFGVYELVAPVMKGFTP